MSYSAEKSLNEVVAPGGNNYGSIPSVRDGYERGDILLGDVKKQQNNADYGVVNVEQAYISLPSNPYGVLQLSSK